MKKIILGFICLMSLVLCTSKNNVHAAESEYSCNDTLISYKIDNFSDGSYIVYELYEIYSMNNYTLDLNYSSNSTYYKTGKRNVTKYDSNNTLVWQYTLSATYEIFDNESVLCIDSNYSTTINNSFWSFSDGSAYYNENIAYGKGKFIYKVLWLFASETVEIDINLKCDCNGNLY